ncbi:hypothetical protein EYF80_028094 [Liparis tanakae]|uniref:Uncharacterized protein n=1 Tax=Liparis tanakae TaxID=230148 RepID=A0A4Z2H9W3_9TELE|nr:hypothetical protein EYF80_028094 [Liparis tanakae]
MAEGGEADLELWLCGKPNQGTDSLDQSCTKENTAAPCQLTGLGFHLFDTRQEGCATGAHALDTQFELLFSKARGDVRQILEVGGDVLRELEEKLGSEVWQGCDPEDATALLHFVPAAGHLIAVHQARQAGLRSGGLHGCKVGHLQETVPNLCEAAHVELALDVMGENGELFSPGDDRVAALVEGFCHGHSFRGHDRPSLAGQQKEVGHQLHFALTCVTDGGETLPLLQTDTGARSLKQYRDLVRLVPDELDRPGGLMLVTNRAPAGTSLVFEHSTHLYWKVPLSRTGESWKKRPLFPEIQSGAARSRYSTMRKQEGVVAAERLLLDGVKLKRKNKFIYA